MKISHNTLTNIFAYILLIMLFPSMCLTIGSQYIFIRVLVVLLCTVFILAVQYNKFRNTMILLFKKTPFKYLVYFLSWAIITIIVAVLCSRIYIGGIINSFLGGLIFSVILPCIITVYILRNYLSIKFFIKLIYLFTYITLLIGFIEFFANLYNIQFIKLIIEVLRIPNEYTFLLGSGVSRCRSLFQEPSFFAYYLLTISPIIYELTFSKYRIFCNKYLNNVLKKTMIPFMWICLICTQSPIFLIFNILFSLLYIIVIKKAYKKILKNFNLYLFIFAIWVIILIIILINVDLSSTYLNRVLIVISNFKSFSSLIYLEPSLLTRIIIFINGFEMGLKHIIFGIGYGNMSYMIGEKLSTSTVPLTQELIMFVVKNKTNPASSIFIKLFSETGFIGIMIYYLFLYKCINELSLIKEKYYGLIRVFINGLILFMIVYACSTIYDSNLNMTYIYILFGLVLNFIIQKKESVK